MTEKKPHVKPGQIIDGIKVGRRNQITRRMFQIIDEVCYNRTDETCCCGGGDPMNFKEDPGPWTEAYLRQYHTTASEWEPL